MQIYGNDILPVGYTINVTTDKKKVAVGALIEIVDNRNHVINLAKITELKKAPLGVFKKRVIVAQIIA